MKRDTTLQKNLRQGASLLVMTLAAIPGLAGAQGEINVLGQNGVKIFSGDLVAAVADTTFFGVVTLGDGQSLTRTFTIENTADLVFDQLFLNGSPRVQVGGEHPDEFAVSQPDAPLLYGGTSTTFTVTFTPAAGAIRNAVLTIPNSDSNEDPYTFAIQATVKLALNYSAAPDGTISGSASQSVFSSQNGSSVTAVASSGSYFVDWSDGSTANPRRDFNVTSNVSVHARYFSYTSSGSEITVTDCDRSLGGTLTIPDTIDGLPVTGIGNNAFWGCQALTGITLPAGLTTIGSNAFEECRALESLVIPAGVTNIGEAAFSDCQSLASVNIPPGITSITAGTFINCPLTSLPLPESVTSIGALAFAGCSQLLALDLPDGVTSIGHEAFVGCSGLTSFVIPDGITEIEAATFVGCSGLTNLTIPESVTTIGEEAFVGCIGLTDLAIPNGITVIADDVFGDCSGLTSFTIPAGVTSIGSGSFEGCVGLTSIVIPESVTSIGERAFADCSSLAEITIEGDAPSLGSSVFSGVAAGATVIVLDQYAEGFSFGSGYGGVPISGLSPLSFTSTATEATVTDCHSGARGSLTIPSSFEGLPVTSIGYGAFSACHLTSVTIPAGITTIAAHAFSYCSDLETVSIPEGVTSIGDNAFYNGNKLQSLVIPDSVTSVGSELCHRCAQLTSVQLGNGLPLIRARMFAYCSRLSEVTIGNSVAVVEASAFIYCYRLEELVLPASVTTIGERAFDRAGLRSITISPGLTDIGYGAFARTQLESINIPDSVVTIGEDAFRECSNLETATIGDGVTTIGERAFSDCNAMTLISLGSSVAVIGSRAFASCHELESITIPEGVTIIEEGTFGACARLERVTIPSSVTTIGSNAFSDCSSLTDVTIPSGVTTIPRGAFEDCSSLTNLFVPTSVTMIGDEAFYGSGLVSIFFEGNAPTLEEDGFGRLDPGASVFYISGTTGFGTFFGGVPAYAVSYASTATAGTITGLDPDATGGLVIPERIGGVPVTTIGDSAFSGCLNLRTITLPDSITSIGSDAFSGCEDLGELVFLGDAPDLGAGAFDWLAANAHIVAIQPDAKGFVYRGTFGGLPVTGLDPHADPYGTGVSNLLTYAFFGPDRDPATVSPNELPLISSVDGSLHCAFTQPANVSGVIYGAEWNSTLGNDWQDIPDTDADPQAYDFSLPIEEGKKFMRLTVSEQ